MKRWYLKTRFCSVYECQVKFSITILFLYKIDISIRMGPITSIWVFIFFFYISLNFLYQIIMFVFSSVSQWLVAVVVVKLFIINHKNIESENAVDSKNIRQSIERAEFSLVVELWFGEQAPGIALNLVSTRTLQLNFHPIRGLHYHLPVLFDYFHMASVSLGIHASLIAFQYNR